jgi:hypothetical protein
MEVLMRLWTTGLVVAVLSSVALAQNATVTLKKLVEKRQMSVEKSPFGNWENGIDLTLYIDGADVKGARKFGKLKVTKAVDDVGTDLTKKSEDSMDMSEQFQDIQEPMRFGMDENKPKPTGFEVELKLPTPSARGAKSIKQVSGSVSVLVGGEKKVVQVKKLKSGLGKAVEDAALKQVGVTVTLVDPGKAGPMAMMMGEKDKSVTAELSGNIDAIAEVSIVNVAGDKQSQGSMFNDDGPKRVVTYFLENNLSDDMALQIEVWPGQKTLTIPIELKDVTLP